MESQAKADLGRTLDSLSPQLAADATPASHPRQTLANSGFRHWLGDHATIGRAAARGNPPRRHELWRAFRDERVSGLLLITSEIHPSASRFFSCLIQ
jgi:hypothetical protein